MKQRNAGLDICRILAMIGIVLIHVVIQGGVLDVNAENSMNYWAGEWLFICVICSVDIFAMLSGYLGIRKKKASVYRFLELITILLFYSIIITLCFLFIAPDKITGIRAFLNGIFPPLAGKYWYITCFIPVMIFQPYINTMLLALSEKQHLILVALEILIFSCIPSLVSVDFFRFQLGYSFVWLLVLYSIGAYLGRKTSNSAHYPRNRTAIILFFAISLFLLAGNYCGFVLFEGNIRYMVSYTSPFVLVMALLVLVTLANCPKIAASALTEKLSSAAFDVYMIHGHILIYDYVLHDGFTWARQLPWYITPAVCVLCSVLIFIVCAFLGLLRIKLFQKANINGLLQIVSKRIDQILYP